MTTVYSDQVKAEAIARVLAGETVSGVARDMGITRTALQNWVMNVRQPPVTAAQAVMAVSNNQRPTLITLIGDYLDCNFRALQNQATLMGERAWLEAQTTPDLVSVHAELAKRGVALLDRIQPILDRIADEPADSDS